MRLKRHTHFDEAMGWLLRRHGTVAGAARFLDMTPQNLKRVMDEDGTKILARTREWICSKVEDSRG